MRAKHPNHRRDALQKQNAAPGCCLRGNWTTAQKQQPPNAQPVCVTYPDARSLAHCKAFQESRGTGKASAELRTGLATLKSPVSRLAYPDLLAATLSSRTGHEHISRGGKGPWWVPRRRWAKVNRKINEYSGTGSSCDAVATRRLDAWDRKAQGFGGGDVTGSGVVCVQQEAEGGIDGREQWSATGWCVWSSGWNPLCQGSGWVHAVVGQQAFLGSQPPGSVGARPPVGTSGPQGTQGVTSSSRISIHPSSLYKFGIRVYSVSKFQDFPCWPG